MSSSSSSSSVSHRRPVIVLGALITALLLLALAVQQWAVPASGATGDVVAQGSASGASEADGFIADGDSVGVFDGHLPAVANLDPALADALQRAATDALADGVEVRVNSGWRSPDYQALLLRNAVAERGAEEAARWVAEPSASEHVTGEAVDLGPWPALDWLAQFGSDYGLCQIYQNEPWHYELRADAAHNGCPEMFSDPTTDPRTTR